MTEKDGQGTNGGGGGAGRFSERTLALLLFAAVLAYGVIRITSNVYSFLADRRALGSDVAASTAWLYESSSLAAWTILFWLFWFSVRYLRPPRFGWLATAAIHAALAVPASLAHIALMVGLRTFAWWLAGDTYRFDTPDGAPFLYELRKDIPTYIELVLLIFLMQWLIGRYAASPAAVSAPPTLAVGDGPVTHHLPVAEIEHVAAAGNYVEIAWRGQRLLHRATLTGIEAALGPGFARIHRSRLVRKDAVRRVATHKSGDFDVEMDSGETLRGSRRFRGNVEG